MVKFSGCVDNFFCNYVYTYQQITNCLHCLTFWKETKTIGFSDALCTEITSSFVLLFKNYYLLLNTSILKDCIRFDVIVHSFISLHVMIVIPYINFQHVHWQTIVVVYSIFIMYNSSYFVYQGWNHRVDFIWQLKRIITAWFYKIHLCLESINW